MVNKRKILSKSSAETIKFGEKLGQMLKGGDIICFFGDLGSGKTTLIKGIAKGMRINQSKVNSPTFVLMNIYQGRMPLFHFDLYRLSDMNEIHSIGYDEFVYDDGVSVIEWADRLGDHLPEEYLKVELRHKKFNERVMTISSVGKKYEKIYKSLN